MSKSRALTVDFDVISHSASIFLVSTLRTLIYSTCSASVAPSFSFLFAIDVSLSYTITEFFSVASVPRTTNFSLCWSLPSDHAALQTGVARFRFVSLEPDLLQRLDRFSQVASASACFVLSIKSSAYDMNPADSLSLLISISSDQPSCSRVPSRMSRCSACFPARLPRRLRTTRAPVFSPLLDHRFRPSVHEFGRLTAEPIVEHGASQFLGQQASHAFEMFPCTASLSLFYAALSKRRKQVVRTTMAVARKTASFSSSGALCWLTSPHAFSQVSAH